MVLQNDIFHFGKVTGLSIILGLFLWNLSLAQTGPGGIGSATENGLWLRAEDVADTNLATIETWFDFSGNSNDATNNVANQRPQLILNSLLNNQPAVRFDGNNDQMSIADAAILDGTAGITFYTAIRPNNLNGAARGILGKRISSGSSAEYAYTWFFWSSNYLNHDLNSQNNRYNSSPVTYSNSTNYILGFNFDGTRAAAQRCRLYEGSDIIRIANETSTSVVNSNRDLILGALNFNYGTYLGADFGEIIHFNYSLDSLEHMIVQNYLSAKFNIAINSNDLYIQDNPSNGNFDFDVCGIGRIDASTIHDDSKGAARVRILNPSDLDDNEFLFWGHDGGEEQAVETTDVPAGVDARFNRQWRVNEVNGSGSAVDIGSLEIRWDLANLNTVTAGDLRLLVDTDNDGIFSDETAISGAIDLGGNIYSFSGVTAISNNVRFTLATANYSQTPLPISLVEFKGRLVNEKEVSLSWITAAEINNDYFSIERSTDAKNWQLIGIVNGHGNSRKLISYSFKDESPASGKNYYRLKQTDYDGVYTYSSSIQILNSTFTQSIRIYPNPAETELNISSELQVNRLILNDITGKQVLETTSTTIDVSLLEKGLYFLSMSLSNGRLIIERVVIN